VSFTSNLSLDGFRQETKSEEQPHVEANNAGRAPRGYAHGNDALSDHRKSVPSIMKAVSLLAHPIPFSVILATWWPGGGCAP